MTKYFETECIGKKYCEASIDSNLFPLACRKPSNAYLVIVFCDGQDIYLPGLKLSVSRTKLSVLVVVIDLLVCFIFIVYIFT